MESICSGSGILLSRAEPSSQLPVPDHPELPSTAAIWNSGPAVCKDILKQAGSIDMAGCCSTCQFHKSGQDMNETYVLTQIYRTKISVPPSLVSGG